MRIRPFGFAAIVLLALASTPVPAVAQTLPSDVEERLGLPRNREYPPHVRREILREYEQLRRRDMAEERGRRRYDDYDDDRRRYRRGDRYGDDEDRRRYRPAYRYEYGSPY